MRVVDLDRDMRDVIPLSVSPDSEYLFEAMTRQTLDLTGAAPGRSVLDVASGVGQDARALCARGALAVAAEPSARMLALARLKDGEDVEAGHAPPRHVRGWADALPFATGGFDAVYCKGALDHFDTPERAIAEMARVTRSDGRVVLAIANFESLACRLARAAERLRVLCGGAPRRGRRPYDVPHDHFTRYEIGLMREQAAAHLELDRVVGVSLLWGIGAWSRALARLPRSLADRLLAALDAVARRWPGGADVVVLCGRPRRDPA